MDDRSIERVIWLALPLNVDQQDVAKRILRKLDAYGLEIVRKPPGCRICGNPTGACEVPGACL